jgi:restriction system protein
MTICRVKRNNAESRLAAMRANNWKQESVAAVAKGTKTAGEEEVEGTEATDLEEAARDQIAI